MKVRVNRHRISQSIVSMNILLKFYNLNKTKLYRILYGTMILKRGLADQSQANALMEIIQIDS